MDISLILNSSIVNPKMQCQHQFEEHSSDILLVKSGNVDRRTDG